MTSATTVEPEANDDANGSVFKLWERRYTKSIFREKGNLGRKHQYDRARGVLGKGWRWM